MYYCLHNLKMKPSEYLAMDDNEKAFLIAAIDIKIGKDERLMKSRTRKDILKSRGR